VGLALGCATIDLVCVRPGLTNVVYGRECPNER
jgi:hypothetical protein